MAQRERIATWPSDRASRVTVAPTETLSGNRTLTEADVERYQALIFNPSTTSRNVDLPLTANCAGVNLFIGNLGTATGTLVVRTSTGTTITTIPVAAAGVVKGAWLFCDGTNWSGMLGA